MITTVRTTAENCRGEGRSRFITVSHRYTGTSIDIYIKLYPSFTAFNVYTSKFNIYTHSTQDYVLI